MRALVSRPLSQHIFALLLAASTILTSSSAQSRPPTVAPSKRQGTFTVSGKLADKTGRPMSAWTVEICEVDKDGGILFKVGDKGTFLGFAGTGPTDAAGVFRILVKKSYFDGERIRFRLRTYRGTSATFPGQGNPHRDIEAKTGLPAIFAVDDEIKELDLTKDFGGVIKIKE